MAPDWRAAAVAFRAKARRDPADFDAAQKAISAVAAAVERGEAPLAPEAPAPAPGTAAVSIACCSHRPERLEAMRRHFAQALGPRPHEFVAVTDARSLAEGYNRALERCRHGIVVFTHDDVELVSPAPFEALERALGGHDIVGLAGSRLVNGPAVMWAGHPHLHGWVAYPAPPGEAGFKATAYSLESGVLGGMQSLDGLLIAARREAARRIGFDAATFDGFHFYDLDFCWRAHLAGLRLAVTTEVVAIHASLGRFDESWQRAAGRFREKYPALAAPKGAHHHYAARLSSRGKLLRFYRELAALGAAS